MRSLFVAFLLLAAGTACADDLDNLKATAMRYVTAMKAVLTLPEASGCLETIAKATEYAAAKIAYYKAARQAMPALLQMAKGKQTDSRYGEELTEIFRDFREDQDAQATATLDAKLHQCLRSNERMKP